MLYEIACDDYCDIIAWCMEQVTIKRLLFFGSSSEKKIEVVMNILLEELICPQQTYIWVAEVSIVSGCMKPA